MKLVLKREAPFFINANEPNNKPAKFSSYPDVWWCFCFKNLETKLKRDCGDHEHHREKKTQFEKSNSNIDEE